MTIFNNEMMRVFDHLAALAEKDEEIHNLMYVTVQDGIIIERLSACLRFDEENPTESESEKAIRAAIKEIERLRHELSDTYDEILITQKEGVNG